jgi:hypothetical protein
MNSSANGLPKHLPHRFPVGATYVVEGYGGEDGDLRVISRYVVLPGGSRINVPGAVRPPVPVAAAAIRRTANQLQSQEKVGTARGTEKIRGLRRNGMRTAELIRWRRAKPPSPSPSITRRRTLVA